MAPHGPDQKTFEEAVDETKASKPQEIAETLAFMFEVSAIPHVTEHALELPSRSVLAQPPAFVPRVQLYNLLMPLGEVSKRIASRCVSSGKCGS